MESRVLPVARKPTSSIEQGCFDGVGHEGAFVSRLRHGVVPVQVSTPKCGGSCKACSNLLSWCAAQSGPGDVKNVILVHHIEKVLEPLQTSHTLHSRLSSRGADATDSPVVINNLQPPRAQRVEEVEAMVSLADTNKLKLPRNGVAEKATERHDVS